MPAHTHNKERWSETDLLVVDDGRRHCGAGLKHQQSAGQASRPAQVAPASATSRTRNDHLRRIDLLINLNTAYVPLLFGRVESADETPSGSGWSASVKSGRTNYRCVHRWEAGRWFTRVFELWKKERISPLP